MNDYDRYLTGVKTSSIDLFATWQPDTQRQIGDVGRMRGYRFEKTGTLGDYGIDFRAHHEPAESPLYEWSSDDCVEVGVQGRAAAPGVGSAETSFEFGRRGGALLRAADCWAEVIEDIHQVEERIKAKHRQGSWPGRRWVVTRVVHAKRTTVLLASAGKTTARLRVKGGAVAGIDLTAADIELTNAAEFRSGTKILSKGDLTPLFEARRLRRRLSETGRQLTAMDGDEPAATTDGPLPGSLYFDDAVDGPELEDDDDEAS
jgi:hypothetical protein